MTTRSELELKKLKRENLRLQAELLRDDLTGLYNARCLRAELENRIEFLAKKGSKPCLLFIDVDYFKDINEKHGHLAAGAILGEVGRLIKKFVRRHDIAYRYGGDEFVVLVSGGLEGAERVGERIRSGLARHVFRVKGLRGQAAVHLTVSAGIRVIRPGETCEEVLEAADRAMYEAKRNSRNTLVAA